MELLELEEPELVFGEGAHVCPRHGITEFGVVDAGVGSRREKIVLGIVSTEEGIEQFQSFLAWSSSVVSTDNTNERLFPSFCGVSKEYGFHTSFTTGDGVQQLIPDSAIRTIKSITKFPDRVRSAVDLFLEKIEFLRSHRSVDVIVCVLPESLYDSVRSPGADPGGDPEELKTQYETSARNLDFRALLKSRAMKFGIPLQLVRAVNLGKKAKASQNSATRAWNLCTALFFKANKTGPWKLHSTNVAHPTCYLGISFFKSLDQSRLDSSTAQIFDEYGKSVILRGRPAAIRKADRTPYLQREDAATLLTDALHAYRSVVSSAPGRLVLHKTSKFLDEEIQGFEAVAKAERIELLDLVSITRTPVRMYREHEYPPQRGTMLRMDEKSAIMYTRGSVPFFKTYPGQYIPEPLEISVFRSARSLKTVCSEILALTKMNWNNTQFDNKNPITLGCARRVGEVIKYLSDDEVPQSSYAFYM